MHACTHTHTVTHTLLVICTVSENNFAILVIIIYSIDLCLANCLSKRNKDFLQSVLWEGMGSISQQVRQLRTSAHE